jgi:hydrogenase maturation protein HypF
VASDDAGDVEVPVSVDVGPCDACLAELADPQDRRFGHPFINCTDCGPRYTITRRVPYDRPVTTMAGFPMCEACRASTTTRRIVASTRNRCAVPTAGRSWR